MGKMMNKTDKIFIAGHNGLVGSAIVRKLRAQGFDNLLLRTSGQLNLTRQLEVENFFNEEKIDYVFLAAARVGGINANDTMPADFIRDNLFIQSNVIDSAYKAKVKKLLFLGSSCIYPRDAPQPLKEKYLLTGPLEQTNEWYAIAKIAGIKMCQAYRKQYGFKAISLMPTNLYGPGDNFDLYSSHVLPALIRKFHEAKLSGAEKVEVWGTGKPLREFLHVDDLASASIFLMDNYNEPEIINVGTGEDISIKALAQLISSVVGYEGGIYFNSEMPDGTPRKWLDISRLTTLGWRPSIKLREGVESSYSWYLEQ